GWFVYASLRPPEAAGFAVEAKDLVQTVVASGRVEPAARLQVGGTILGVLSRVTAEEGQKVRQGDVLARYADDELRASVEAAEAAVKQAELKLESLQSVGTPRAEEDRKQADTALARAREDFERLSALRTQNAVSQAKLDEAAASLDLARSRHQNALLVVASLQECGIEYRAACAGIAQAEAHLAAARARLGQAAVAAPADAKVLRRWVEPGDVVTPGRTLFTLAADGETRIVAAVDEKNVPGIEPGQAAAVSAEGYPGERFSARVLRIAPAVDAARGTVDVTLVVEAPPAFLRVDMTVTVEMELMRRKNALVVPLEALRDAASSAPWVLVLRAGRAERAGVEVGFRGDRGVELRSGVKTGDVVLLPGKVPIEPGRKVRLLEAPGARGGR
ncbi:MAG: efflux RND transporter periplasmic adaptor subunit, partial [Planctomycetes bacterium]|nr:efflux RND transporter periplasmic adaptor subunit [Planctomycetota bacterium]